MLKQKIFLIIGIVIFVNLGLFFFFRSQDQNKTTTVSDQSTSSGKQVVDQPETQPDRDLPSAGVDQPVSTPVAGILIGDGSPWTLIYDAPGSPAATFELVFTDQSRCDFGGGDVSCSPMYYEVGTGIEVTGQKDGSQLVVSHIKRAVNLMPPQ